jgi:hypothetical protein
MPSPGDTYKILKSIPSTNGGHINAGQIVKVREVVPANVKGAHTDSEDSIVVEFEDNGATRAYAFGVNTLDEWLGKA